MFYAHIREDGKKQTVDEHLSGTADLCSRFASGFGQSQRGWLLGYAHDIGKCSAAFQRRLAGGPKVDHATAGALECAKINEMLSACCVAGHHGGLPDYGNTKADPAGAPSLVGRLKKGIANGIPEYTCPGALSLAPPPPPFNDNFITALWVRMLYSCLVDADYLDTESFMALEPVNRSGYENISSLVKKLEEYIRPWFPPTNPLNQCRCDVLQQCIRAASQPRGLYSLTVPTGGGKTVASLAFALHHAAAHGLERVIYVIPYTSIIEQTAGEFRKILGEKNVIEHHSALCLDEDDETTPENHRKRLAAENWDAPVIVTTAVQFFESLYSNRPSQCRKLHNIANSVVIFDEAQMLPMGHLLPCTGLIAALVRHFNVSAVLCTATQPVLQDLISSFAPGLQTTEICPGQGSLYQKLRRVSYRSGGKLSNAELCAELSALEQVLCIVNTRKTAQALFETLPQEGSYHLSTLMYPAHRKAVLREIRSRLKNGLSCRVVSTSLIEAGVDIDFPAVYRELAGLDSIAQAAGRCNREGKRPAESSVVTYFESEASAPLLQQVNIGAAREALASGGDPGDPETVRRYFSILRTLAGPQLDKSQTVERLRHGIHGCSLPFETVARDFHFIDTSGYTVYIPTEESASLCQKLLEGSADRADFRRAGQYGVSIYEQHYKALLAAGNIIPIGQDAAVLTTPELYSPVTGLSLRADAGRAEFI